MGAAMIGGFGKITAHPGKRDDMIAFLKWDGQVARDDEPGTLRFDIFADPDDENVVYFFELYVDQAAVEAHMASPPFQKLLRGELADCIASVEPIMNLAECIWPTAE